MARDVAGLAAIALAVLGCAAGEADESVWAGAPEIDGHLDCAGEFAQEKVVARVDSNGDYDTATEAVEKQLTWLLERFPSDAEIVERGQAGSIVTDGREVAETRALEGEDGRWFTDEENWCGE